MQCLRWKTTEEFKDQKYWNDFYTANTECNWHSSHDCSSFGLFWWLFLSLWLQGYRSPWLESFQITIILRLLPFCFHRSSKWLILHVVHSSPNHTNRRLHIFFEYISFTLTQLNVVNVNSSICRHVFFDWFAILFTQLCCNFYVCHSFKTSINSFNQFG